MDAEKEMQELEIVPKQETTTTAAPKRRRGRKKTVVTQPSAQVEALLGLQREKKEEHYGVGDELPTHLM